MQKRYSYLFGCGYPKKMATSSISYIQSGLVVPEIEELVLDSYLFGCGYHKKVATPSISYIQSGLIVPDFEEVFFH